MNSERLIILYDGVCGFCNETVQFILTKDLKQSFYFAALQSPAAENLLTRHPEIPHDLDTLILLEGERAYIRSDAALRIASRLSGVWSMLRFLKIIPRPIRDFFYRAFARRRYRWFGLLDACPLPSAETRSRFLN